MELDSYQRTTSGAFCGRKDLPVKLSNSMRMVFPNNSEMTIQKATGSLPSNSNLCGDIGMVPHEYSGRFIHFVGSAISCRSTPAKRGTRTSGIRRESCSGTSEGYTVRQHYTHALVGDDCADENSTLPH